MILLNLRLDVLIKDKKKSELTLNEASACDCVDALCSELLEEISNPRPDREAEEDDSE